MSEEGGGEPKSGKEERAGRGLSALRLFNPSPPDPLLSCDQVHPADRFINKE